MATAKHKHDVITRTPIKEADLVMFRCRQYRTWFCAEE